MINFFHWLQSLWQAGTLLILRLRLNTCWETKINWCLKETWKGPYSGVPVDELQERYDTTLRALLDKHAPCRTARHRCQPTTPWFDADCAKAKRRTRAFGIGGRSWILIGWSGLDKPGRNNNSYCSPPNKISSGRRQFLTARATPRNYGGIFRVFYERSNRNLRIQVSWLPSDSRMPSRRNSQGCDQRLHLLPHRSSMDHHVLSTWWDSNPLIPLLHNVSSAMQHASHRSLTQFLPGSFRNSPWNCHRSSPPCLTRRWVVGIFRLHRRSHPSLRSSRRHLWIHSTSATTGQFQTSPSSRSSLSVPPTSKSLDIWSVTIYSRYCNQPTRNIVPRRRRQSKWCLTSTEQLTQALSRCSAFSISAPLSILSTTGSFWFDFNIVTASRGSCSDGSSLTWQGVRSSYVSMVKPRPRRWSLPVSLRDRCSARSSLSHILQKSLASWSSTVSTCTLLPMTYRSTGTLRSTKLLS